MNTRLLIYGNVSHIVTSFVKYYYLCCLPQNSSVICIVICAHITYNIQHTLIQCCIESFIYNCCNGVGVIECYRCRKYCMSQIIGTRKNCLCFDGTTKNANNVVDNVLDILLLYLDLILLLFDLLCFNV